jgi:antirestriction protein
MMATETEPRLWVGCLSCYNNGTLHGAWLTAEQCEGPLRETAPELAREGHYAMFAALVNDETTDAEALYGGAAYDRCEVCGGDEWWGMDVEGLPASWSEEMSPADFVGKCQLRDQIEGESYDVDAYVAYESMVGAEYANPDEFMDAYQGHYDSRTAFGEEMWGEAGYGAEIPEHLQAYFDVEAWTRDLFIGGDYWADETASGVYVFRAS